MINMRNWNVLVLLILAYCHIPHNVFGFSTASFTGDANDETSTFYKACTLLFPQGHGAPAQTSANPYTLTVTGGPWKYGEQLTVTLAGTSSTMFKGFMIQARSKADNSVLMGSFGAVTGTKQNCGGHALTHDSSADKQSVQLTWTAPSSGSKETMQFVYTIVKQQDTFWMTQKSEDIAWDDSTSDDNPSDGNPKNHAGAVHMTIGSGILLAMLALFV